MTDDDFRDLLYVVRAIRRTYQRGYDSFRHGTESDNADAIFDRLCEHYLGSTLKVYPQYEARMLGSEERAEDLAMRTRDAAAEGKRKLDEFMGKKP